MENNKLLMTPEELSKYTGIGINRCQLLLKRTDFPAIYIGNKRMAIKSEINPWLIKHIGKAI